MRLIFILLYFLILHCLGAFGQSTEFIIHSDSLFYQARALAFAGKHKESRIILDNLLKKNSAHADARILMAKTFAWEANYTEAMKQIDHILKIDSLNQEAMFAKIDFEIWDEQYERALILVNTSPGINPRSPELLFKKSQLLFLLKRNHEALAQLDVLLSLNTFSDEAIKLKNIILTEQLKYLIETSYGFDFYNRLFPNARYASTSFARKNTWGSAIIRVNYSNRFLRNSLQTELEAYPKLYKGIYGYLNYGFSQGSLFPKHRFGVELYSTISAAIDISIGTRILDLQLADKLFLYTGSIAWNHNRYSLVLRPFVVLKQSLKAWSASCNLRRYFGKSELGISGNFGISPDDRNLQNSTGVTTEYNYGLKSQSLSLYMNKSLNRNFTIKASYETSHRELAFGLDQFVWIHSLQLTTSKKF